VLARLDPEDLSGNVRAAEAAAAAADVQLRTALSTAERTRSLAGRNVTSTAQLEQAERALAAAAAAAAQAQSQLVRARDALDSAEMKAPFAGIVSAVQATVGTVAAAGQPVLTLSAETGREANIDLTQTQLKGIVPGTAFLVRRDIVGAAPIAGRVSRIDPEADPRTRTRRVHVTLEDGAGFRLGSLIRASRADRPAPR
ncbi:MAG TPA: efflux RND transporter periplasmic adaptor subunit, partial [Paracoccus sp. (in: a-proteobacteria)]|nr:efflux RND transporter periplasmic adaptor subunit [Paracoccus sp. (in: a-proteobacteria)]